jgi:hypothetical protein
MDSIGDSSPSAMKISSSSAAGTSSSGSGNINGNINGNGNGSDNNNNNGRSNNNNDYINSIVLPPAFVEDPAGFLTSIASRPNPSPDGISLLAGPLSKWFLGAEESQRESRYTSSSSSSSNSNRLTTTATSGQNAPVHPAAHVAQLYLCAAATQLREEQHQPQAMGVAGVGSAAVASAVAGIATSAANLISKEQQKNKNRNTKHRDETLEAVASAAVLCLDRSEISSSGILPVLANLVASTSSTNSGGSASASNNKLASSIATSLSNLSSSSSKAFPTLTPAHTAFLQCAVQAEEYEFAETVIRGTWPLPTSTLKKKKGNVNDDSPHASISIILRYYYLRGIVHYGCGRDHYSMAHRCWWTCLCIPVDIVSNIAVQAWKKLTLVQPLLDINDNNSEGGRPSRTDAIDVDIDGNTKITSVGSPATFSVSKRKSKAHPETRLPKCLTKSIRTLIDFSIIDTRKQEDHQTTGAVESSGEKNLYSVYTHLGPAVEAVDRTSVESLVRAHESVLTADGNMGMAHNCLRRVKELQVRTASKMFSVTSVQILARRWRVTPEEASQQLFDAMKLGVVPCRVEKDGTVLFLSPKDSASNSTTTSTDWADLTGWMKLLEQLQRMDVNLSISSKYNAVKRKEDKGTICGMIGTAGPRGVEEFYGDPTI